MHMCVCTHVCGCVGVNGDGAKMQLLRGCGVFIPQSWVQILLLPLTGLESLDKSLSKLEFLCVSDSYDGTLG